MRELERFLAGVERRALRMAEIATGSRDDALDIVQDSMLQLCRVYADREPGQWAPLFQRILQSRIRDWYRRESVRRRWRAWWKDNPDEDGEHPLERVADPRGEGPEEHLQARELESRLEGILRELPLRQQQALMLRVWEGLDVAQSARAMGCSRGSVKTHLSRALERLRTSLYELSK